MAAYLLVGLLPLHLDAAACPPGEAVMAFFAGEIDLGSGPVPCKLDMSECFYAGKVASGPDASGTITVDWDDGDVNNRKVAHAQVRSVATGQACDGPPKPAGKAPPRAKLKPASTAQEDAWIAPEIFCTILPWLFCEANPACDSFTTCPASTPVNKGSGVTCTTGTCDAATCCEANPTCDSFTTCPRSTPVNRGSGVTCMTGTCNADTCCEANPCSAPTGVTNGAANVCTEGASISSGSSCTTACALGYTPSDTSLSCTAGTLNPTTFTCQATCKSLRDAIENCPAGTTPKGGSNATAVTIASPFVTACCEACASGQSSNGRRRSFTLCANGYTEENPATDFGCCQECESGYSFLWDWDEFKKPCPAGHSPDRPTPRRDVVSGCCKATWLTFWPKALSHLGLQHADSNTWYHVGQLIGFIILHLR